MSSITISKWLWGGILLVVAVTTGKSVYFAGTFVVLGVGYMLEHLKEEINK